MASRRPSGPTISRPSPPGAIERYILEQMHYQPVVPEIALAYAQGTGVEFTPHLRASFRRAARSSPPPVLSPGTRSSPGQPAVAAGRLCGPPGLRTLPSGTTNGQSTRSISGSRARCSESCSCERRLAVSRSRWSRWNGRSATGLESWATAEIPQLIHAPLSEKDLSQPSTPLLGASPNGGQGGPTCAVSISSSPTTCGGRPPRRITSAAFIRTDPLPSAAFFDAQMANFYGAVAAVVANAVVTVVVTL